MCFSAAGSFGMSGVLAVVGTTSLARSAGRPQHMFAAVPFIFAAQQAAEGARQCIVETGGRAVADLPRRLGDEPQSLPRHHASEGAMCFSAAGSFGMSGVLAVVGATSLARSAGRPQQLFAPGP